MPVIRGRKTPAERFPGAVDTFCIEAMMQDRKALQAGTSHFLGQNFAKASGIHFQSADETEEFAWTTSWGSSTRLIGGLIMTHGDDDGLVLPPRVASAQVVLLPILHKEEDRSRVMAYTEKIAAQLRATAYHGRNLVVEVDARDIGGARGWDWIKKGIPLRVEIGPRDMEKDAVFVGRRDKGHREKTSMRRADFIAGVTGLLDDIQARMYRRALEHRADHTVSIDDPVEFEGFFTPEDKDAPGIHGGFARSHWCGNAACEAKIKGDLNVTIRCLPLEGEAEDGRCIGCGQPSSLRVVYAKSY